MGTAVVVRLLAWCLLAASAAAQTPGATWETPKFIEPEDHPDFNYTDNSDVSPGAIIISLNEHATPIIAYINYAGEITPTSTVENELKIKYAWSGDDNMWTMAVTESCDFDNGGETRFEWSVNIDNELVYVNLNLQNINDNEPQFLNAERSCKVEEWIGKEEDFVPGGETNCSFQVRDIDGDVASTLITVLENGEVSDTFKAIRKGDPNTDKTDQDYVLVLEKPLDYEKLAVSILSIEASDGDHVIEMAYVVNVDDLPDTAPVWDNYLPSLNIDEKTPEEATVTAHDGDVSINDEISYKLEVVEDKYAEFFNIGQKDGLLTIQPIDRDTLKQETFKIVLTAYETNDESSYVTQEVVVIVNDINDNSPEITMDRSSIEVNETYSGTFEFGITITDPDLAENGRFNIKLDENTWSSAFLVVPASGYQSTDVTISVLDPASLDYEDVDWRTITLTVVATEVANTSHVGYEDFTIVLLDVNDEYPVFTQSQYGAELEESVDLDTFVATITATDLDEGDEITYKIVPSTQFQVDALTGTVTVKKALDYESAQELTLQLTATDKVNHNAYSELYVTILDVNDEQPDISVEPPMTNVTEDTEEDLFVAEITASDPDTTANLVLSIDWDKSSATKLGRKIVNAELYRDSFHIEPVEDNDRDVVANLIATGNRKLDWGNVDTVYLVVMVTDTATAEQYVEQKSTKTVQMTITVDDINNKAPVFNEVGKLTVKEEDEDYTIGFVVAVDDDGPLNNEVYYTINGAEEMYDGFVTINSDTGEMRTIKKIDCDTAGYATIHLNVTASDGVHDTPMSISIDVTDINDNKPIFGDFPKNVQIPEGSGDDTVVANIIAEDHDLTHPFNFVSYLMEETEDNEGSLPYFAVNRTSGELYVKLAEGRELDRETTATYTMTITARDNFVNGWEEDTNSATVIITVQLTDINDNAPTFTPRDEVEDADGCFKPAVMNYISESTKKGDLIGKVEATDPDEGINGAVSYYIISITDKSTEEELEEPLLFSVDEETGNVIAAIDLQDRWGEYDVLLQAFDHAEDPLNSTVTYTFCVRDENDHDPEFVYPMDDDTILLQDTQVIGEQLMDWTNNPLRDFEVTDKDDISTGNGLVTLTIADGANDIFEIKAIEDYKFRLLVKQDLKTVAETSFELQLQATDGGSQPRSNSIVVNITVIYITQMPPAFEESTWELKFHENDTYPDESETIPEAKDPNNEYFQPGDELYQQVYYYIVGGDEEHFHLNTSTRELKVNMDNPLDYEITKSHIIYVEASNSNEKPIDTVLEDNTAVLKCLIEVIDVNDMPPHFNQELYAKGFTIDSTLYTVILTLEAEDPDVGDIVTYVMNGDIAASSASLSAIKDEALKLDPDGTLKLNFEPKDETLDGYFSFIARAKDSLGDAEGHYADVPVQVYVISNIHRVTFQFLNNETYVAANSDEMEQIFKEVFKYECDIETTKASVDPSSGVALTDSTDVVAHFIDTAKQLPVEKDVITRKFYEQETFKSLQSAFWNNLHLDLKSYQEAGNTDATNIEGILTIILIVVSAVLGTMVIVLFVAFFLRTKTLKRRLEAVQELQFGSQNSGLNRGVAVPNTNKHAVEGSNPMWKTDAVIDYDNVSQGSGDSDMIGIEDNPEFQPSKKNSHFLDGPQQRKLTGILNKEFTFHPDDSDDKSKIENQYLSPNSAGEVQQPRRITETLNNNFILQYDPDANEVNQKTQSVNPLASGNLSNTANYEGNDNFSFKPTDTVPVTQL